MITLEQIKTLINGLKLIIPPWVKPDLTENDKNSPNYVKGRTHWVDEKGKVHKIPKEYMPELPDSYREEIQQIAQDEALSAADGALHDAIAADQNIVVTWDHKTSGIKIHAQPFKKGNTAYSITQEQYPITRNGEWAQLNPYIGYEGFLDKRRKPWGVVGLNLTYYWTYTKEDGQTYRSRNKYKTSATVQLYGSTRSNAFVCVTTLEVETKTGNSVTVEVPFMAIIDVPGHHRFQLGNTTKQFDITFRGTGLFLCKDLNVPEHEVKVTCDNVDLPYGVSLVGNCIDPQDLPVLVKPIYLEGLYDELEVGSYSTINHLSSGSNWKTSTWWTRPFYLLIDKELLAKVTYHYPEADESITDLPDCTRANYRIDFQGGSIIEEQGQRMYRYFEGTVLYSTAPSNGIRFYLRKREVTPLGVPPYSPDQHEGMALKIVNGSPAWAEAIDAEFAEGVNF